MTFENLVNSLNKMSPNDNSYEQAKAMCEGIARMDIKDYDNHVNEEWIAYDKKGFGTIVLTRNKKGGIKEIRAWNEDKTFVK